MRLTIEHLRRAPQFTNTLLQREIDLRGLCISVLDANALIQLNDEFDVINLCNNALSSLDSFPGTSSISGSKKMMRVSTIIAHRNKLQKVHIESCVQALPAVRYFVADKNLFSSAKDLVFLSYWRNLEVVSLQQNPFWKSNPEGLQEKELRAFLCFLCPKLRLIDGNRVTKADKESAASLKPRFEGLLHGWGASSAVSGGKKSRKRGRGKDPVSENNVAGTARGETRGDTSDDVEEQRRKLAEMEERLSAPDLTAEELDQLGRRISELTSRFH
eukprot:gene13389-9215_t